MKIKNIYKKIKNCPINPSFFLLFLWFLFCNKIAYFFLFIFVVLSHEEGHYLVAKKLGYKLDSFNIAPFGVSLNYKEICFSPIDEIMIALAGPLANFVLSFFTMALWWIFPVLYNVSQEFVFQSLMLGLFNLLPCYPLDGGRVFAGLLSQKISRKKAVEITVYLNYFFACLLFILFGISCKINFNPTFSLCGIFLVLSGISSQKESEYKQILYVKKLNKNFSSPLYLSVNKLVTISSLIKHIELNRLTIFVFADGGKTYFINENEVKKLSLIFPSNTKLGDVFKLEKE